MDLDEKTINETTMFSGKILEVTQKEVLLPNHNTAFREIVNVQNAVCIAAVTSNNEVIFEKQFRSPFNKTILELPAGKMEKSDPSPLHTAIRELKEETGIIASNYKSLGTFYSSPGFCNEIIHLYSCEVESTGDTHLDNDEFISTTKIPLSTAIDMVLNNEIEDGKTQALILKLYALNNKYNLNNG